MRLDELIGRSKNLRAELDGLDELGKQPDGKHNIHVHAYVVRAHWRYNHWLDKRPRLMRDRLRRVK